MAAKKTTKRRRHKSPKYSDAKVLECLAAWLSMGSSKQAAKAHKVPATTIKTWRKSRPELWQQVIAEHEQFISEVRASLAETTTSGLMAGAARARAKLESGEELAPRDLAALIRALSEIDGTQDRIRRLDAGKPTDRFSLEDGADVVSALDGILAELKK